MRPAETGHVSPASRCGTRTRSGAPCKSILVIAGADSGKTNTPAHRVAHLIVNGADPRPFIENSFGFIFAIVLSVAMLAAFITTIEGEKHVSNSAHPGTIGLAKPHPPLDKAPGEPVRN